MKYWLVVLALISTQTLFSQEFRGGVAADFGILPRVEGEVELEIRKAWIPESYFTRMAQIQVDYILSDRWSAGILYCYSYITESGEHALDESNENLERNRFGINISYQAKRFENDLRISNRLRYQYSSVDDKKPTQYLRNKLTVDYKMTKAMNPYVAVEPYYDLGKTKLGSVRVYLGNEMPLFNTRINIYYISEIRHEEEYLDIQYIIGMTVKLNFRK
jgi:hypothetical protein